MLVVAHRLAYTVLTVVACLLAGGVKPCFLPRLLTQSRRGEDYKAPSQKVANECKSLYQSVVDVFDVHTGISTLLPCDLLICFS